jgi:hypothetical protein
MSFDQVIRQNIFALNHVLYHLTEGIYYCELTMSNIYDGTNFAENK